MQRAINLVGNAQDLSDESKRETSSNPVGSPSPRKLYRDPDGKVIGGVCSGLAYYLHTDVVLIRIIAVILLFFASASFWIYLILWIIMPKAITRAQKLEMRGIPVTPENLNKF